MLVSKIKLENGFKVVKSSNAEKSVLYCYYPNNTLTHNIVLVKVLLRTFQSYNVHSEKIQKFIIPVMVEFKGVYEI